MNLSKKLMIGASGVVVSLGLVAVFSTGTAVALRAHKTVTGTGTVTCGPTAATISFKPPLTPSGTSKETTKLSNVSLGTCTGGTPSGPTPTSVKATIKSSGGKSSCSSFATGTASDTVSFSIKWSGGLKPTTETFKPGTISVESGDTGFTGSGGTSKGSYAGTASFTATIPMNDIDEIAACVEGTAGSTVSGISISGGSSTF